MGINGRLKGSNDCNMNDFVALVGLERQLSFLVDGSPSTSTLCDFDNIL